MQLLKTARSVIFNNKNQKSKKKFVLFNNGPQKSFINRNNKDAWGLHPVRKEGKMLQVFESKNENFCSLNIDQTELRCVNWWVVLVGGDYYWSFFTWGIVPGMIGPVWIEMSLTWILSGHAGVKGSSEYASNTFLSLFVMWRMKEVLEVETSRQCNKWKNSPVVLKEKHIVKTSMETRYWHLTRQLPV